MRRELSNEGKAAISGAAKERWEKYRKTHPENTKPKKRAYRKRVTKESFADLLAKSRQIDKALRKRRSTDENQ